MEFPLRLIARLYHHLLQHLRQHSVASDMSPSNCEGQTMHTELVCWPPAPVLAAAPPQTLSVTSATSHHRPTSFGGCNTSNHDSFRFYNGARASSGFFSEDAVSVQQTLPAVLACYLPRLFEQQWAFNSHVVEGDDPRR